VTVVDDDSSDNTAAIIQQFASAHSYIHYQQLAPQPPRQAHKKRAIEKGIEAGKGELIVCTDADCTHPPNWLWTIARLYESGDVEFIAGPVGYTTENTLLSVFQTLDFMTLQGITGASVSQRFHTMCNGANLAYTRQAFVSVNGFEGIDAQPTGDDMLLMYKIYRQNPNGVCWLKSQDATVQTQACDTWRSFFNQRIRWASKAAYYDDRRIFWVLLLVYVFNAWLLGLAVAAFAVQKAGLALLVALVVKTAIETLFLWPVARFFGKEKWMWTFPLLQPLHIMYTVLAGWLGRFGSYEWKGRRIGGG
jgi:cellulose synthase/poly-beta-1,6-N-acetylglucosamine synthase-like glycosyltransferase